MAGFFGDFDIEGAADDPFSVPAGTYAGTISAFDGDIGGTKKDGSGDYKGMQFTIRITEGPQSGADFDAYFPLPTGKESERAAGFMRSAVKRFLAGMEVAPERMNTIDPEELIGQDVIFKVVERPSKNSSRKFKNLDSIRLASGFTGDLSGDTTIDVSSPDVQDDEFGL
jgi:hypothetical protein